MASRVGRLRWDTSGEAAFVLSLWTKTNWHFRRHREMSKLPGHYAQSIFSKQTNQETECFKLRSSNHIGKYQRQLTSNPESKCQQLQYWLYQRMKKTLSEIFFPQIKAPSPICCEICKIKWMFSENSWKHSQCKKLPKCHMNSFWGQCIYQKDIMDLFFNLLFEILQS